MKKDFLIITQKEVNVIFKIHIGRSHKIQKSIDMLKKNKLRPQTVHNFYYAERVPKINQKSNFKY
jgi:hypothetical protein